MDDAKQPLLNKDGRPVHIKRIAAKGKRGKLIAPNPNANTVSPFDRFNSSNGGGNVKSI